MRTKIALDEKGLWPLLSVIKVACSDDETDVEEGQMGTPGKGPICARRLTWRSTALENVVIRLDAQKTKQDESVPQNTDSPQRGRPSRRRIRRSDGPESAIEAPEGLCKDCYSPAFLKHLGSNGQIILGVKPELCLPEVIKTLDSL